MTDNKKPAMPPVPRDHADASLSELMPFRSTKIKLWKSPVMLFLLLSAVGGVAIFPLLFAILQSPAPQSFEMFKTFVNISIFMMLMAIMLGIYAYSRTDRPIWPFLICFFAVCVILLTPLQIPYWIVFRQILPGKVPPLPTDSVIAHFIKMWFGAGFAEEIMKATPILLGLALTIMAAKKPAAPPNKLLDLLKVRGPLDGVLMGFFAGAGFIMVETAGQYVPDLARGIAQEGGNYGAGLAAGMMLMMPRVLGGAVAHIAWSGIFGYFIGLSAIRRKSMWKLLAIGWVAAATIHGFWNTAMKIHPLMQYVVAIIGAVFAGAALLKARQIDHAELGRDNFTSGSILVEKPRAAAAPAPQPAAAPQTAPAPAPAAPKVEKPLALDIDGFMMPLRAGGVLDLGAEPALSGKGAGVRGSIVPHPTRANVLGLQNGGDSAWTVRLRDGSQQVIERNQNIRLAHGVEIQFGGGVTGRVVAMG